MVSKTAATFAIEYRQILDEHGQLVDTLPKFAEDSATLIAMYKHMVLIRIFDAKAIALQRTGKLGTYPSTLGQEAIGTATASVMQAQDILCPYYRDNATAVWRGVKLEEILLYWGGNEQGSNYINPDVKEDFPICVPISSQTLHAVGIGLAFKLRQQKRAVVVSVGDGGTSRGDFYEAINFAGVQKLPVIFIINNNQWAISVPLELQTATKTLAQKGIAGAVHSEQVDGNDVIVTRQAVSEAFERAHSGQGPSLIEAITYRLCDHTTADDARRYRDEAEVTAARQKDPITRLKKYLETQKLWDETQEKNLIQEATAKVDQAVANYLATPTQDATTMFDYLYKELPRSLEPQRQMVK
jgi:2-oxoisovalerate dehydrogenase E1 component alpha subunit